MVWFDYDFNFQKEKILKIIYSMACVSTLQMTLWQSQ